MAEIRKRVQPVRIDHTCDLCGGPMRHSAMKASNPPQYVHTCQRARFGRCESTEELTFRFILPHIAYEDID